VVANYKKSNATIRQDEYGFTLVNFEHLIPLLTQSFTFLMHDEQGFFVEDVKSPRIWKVVLCQGLKRHGSEFTRELNLELALFNVGNNVDHIGVRVNVKEANAPLVTWDC
jgi:hypothetical protein